MAASSTKTGDTRVVDVLPRALELFLLSNVGFLAVDVWIAHKVNAFAVRAEWIPVYVSIIGAALLAIGCLTGKASPAAGLNRSLGMLVGWVCIATGLAGLYFHLEGHFFTTLSLEGLVYAAPFAAPLAYTGIGFLLLMNRAVDGQQRSWAKWVIFFGWAGFVGNLALSLADHAINGFFNPSEWISVVASAIAVAFVGMLFTPWAGKGFRAICWYVLAAQIVVGMLGAWFHFQANLHSTMSEALDKFIHGAPVFAPLLFANLALLTGIGLYALSKNHATETVAS